MKTYENFIKEASHRLNIDEGMIPWRSPKRPNSSGWMPSEKIQAKKKQIENQLKGKSSESLQNRYDRLTQVLQNPPIRTKNKPHISNFERISGISLGASRRNINQRVMPKNSKRKRIYQSLIGV
ncbi:MAG: hypothetical protein RLZZ44_13 [Bacteroidota bacterium]